LSIFVERFSWIEKYLYTSWVTEMIESLDYRKISKKRVEIINCF